MTHMGFFCAHNRAQTEDENDDHSRSTISTTSVPATTTVIAHNVSMPTTTTTISINASFHINVRTPT